MFCEPLDKEQLRLSIENFERIDNIILYRQENTDRKFIVNGEDAHPISNYEHIKTIVDNYESIKPQVDSYYIPRHRGTTSMWYKNKKYNSLILMKIIDNEKIFKRYNASVDVVIKFIVSLINTSINSQSNKMMDAVIGYRCNLGRENVYNVLSVLCRTFPDIIKMERVYGEVYVKVEKHLLLADPYIKEKVNKFKSKDRWVVNLFRENKKSVYFTPFCQRVSRNKLRQIVMSTTIAYNDLGGNSLKTKSKIRDELEYGKRTDIQYIEIPIHIISMITGLRGDQILGYINRWAKRCDYISKHNKGYSDGCYYDPDYKHSELLEDPKNLTFNNMEDRPPITPTSYILYPEKLNRTKLGKFVKNHIEAYKHIVVRYLKYIKNDRNNRPEEYARFMHDFIYLTDKEIEQISSDYTAEFKQKIKQFSERHPKQELTQEQQDAQAILYNGDMKQGEIIGRNRLMNIRQGNAREKQRVTLKQIEYIDKETGEIKIKSRNKLPYWLKESMNYLEDCPTNEFKPIIKVVNTIVTYIKETIQLYKLEGNKPGLNILKSNLSRYELFEQFEPDFI